jgi:hypothetical protein
MAYKSWSEFKVAWVGALRSGEYRQGKGSLCRPGEKHDSFCCLGVAYDLLVSAGNKGCAWNTDVGSYATLKREDSERIAHDVPKWLQKWLRKMEHDAWDDREQILITLNDDGKSFKKIADWIEKQSP